MLKTTSDKQRADYSEANNIIGDLTPRFLGIGIAHSSNAKMVSTAPLGFPIEINTRGNAHSFREEEVRCIEIEL